MWVQHKSGLGINWMQGAHTIAWHNVVCTPVTRCGKCAGKAHSRYIPETRLIKIPRSLLSVKAACFSFLNVVQRWTCTGCTYTLDGGREVVYKKTFITPKRWPDGSVINTQMSLIRRRLNCTIIFFRYWAYQNKSITAQNGLMSALLCVRGLEVSIWLASSTPASRTVKRPKHIRTLTLHLNFWIQHIYHFFVGCISRLSWPATGVSFYQPYIILNVDCGRRYSDWPSFHGRQESHGVWHHLSRGTLSFGTWPRSGGNIGFNKLVFDTFYACPWRYQRRNWREREGIRFMRSCQQNSFVVWCLQKKSQHRCKRVGLALSANVVPARAHTTASCGYFSIEKPMVMQYNCRASADTRV